MVKRNDYINWDDYFMGIALLSAKRSKDPSTQVGACVVNLEKRILGIGYNGFPIGCSDNKLPWEKKYNSFLYSKYAYVCHAELNAILNSVTKILKNCTLYTILFPCNECSKVIIQVGINKIVYLSNKYESRKEVIASKKMLDLANIEYYQLKPKESHLFIDMLYQVT